MTPTLRLLLRFTAGLFPDRCGNRHIIILVLDLHLIACDINCTIHNLPCRPASTTTIGHILRRKLKGGHQRIDLILVLDAQSLHVQAMLRVVSSTILHEPELSPKLFVDDLRFGQLCDGVIMGGLDVRDDPDDDGHKTPVTEKE